MMTADRFRCDWCGTEEAAVSPHHWNFFIAKHLPCEDLAAANRDRADAHTEKLGKTQQVWFLRAILAITTGWLMIGMHLTGAHPYQWAGVGCFFFVALLFFFEHTPNGDQS